MRLLPLAALALFVVGVVCQSRIATLYTHDSIARTLSFSSGAYGLVFDSNNVYNFQSDVDYGWYATNELTVGIEGGREGTIIDLGSQSDLATRYGYYETVGQGQGYASIKFTSNTSNILQIRTATQNVFQTLTESSILYNSSAAGAHLVPTVDHILLARLYDSRDATFERVVKILVLAVNPDYVTFRWDVLRDTQPSSVPPSTNATIVQMYPSDSLQDTLSFSLGVGGHCWCEAYTCDYCDKCNCYSDLDYDRYFPDGLSSGIEGGRVANLIDVGTPDDISTVYNENVDAFASLRLSGNSVVFGTNPIPFNRRNESTLLFGTPSPYYVSVLANTSHIYLVRITDTYDATFDRIVKMQVLHINPHQKLTLRYEVLRDTDPSNPYPDRSFNGTGISTLYATDPLWSKMGFDTDSNGAVFDDGNVYNAGSDIDFNNYLEDGFSIGIEGGRLGVILSLGTPSEFLTSLNDITYDAFASIYYNVTTNKLVILNRTNERPLTLQQSALFVNGSSNAGILVNTTTLYLARLTDMWEPTFQRIAKILVLNYVPGQEVTFRWSNLNRDLPASTTGMGDSTTNGVGIGLATTGAVGGGPVTTGGANTTDASSEQSSANSIVFQFAAIIAALMFLY